MRFYSHRVSSDTLFLMEVYFIMAYQGNLITIMPYATGQTPYVIPLKYIRAETYSVLRSGQDIDSGRNQFGDLERHALDNFLYKVEFETVPLMTNTEMTELMSQIAARYTSAVEKKCLVRLYVPELDSYVQQYCYVPDITFQMYYADSTEIKYNQTRIAFIGYGKGASA